MTILFPMSVHMLCCRHPKAILLSSCGEKKKPSKQNAARSCQDRFSKSEPFQKSNLKEPFAIPVRINPVKFIFNSIVLPHPNGVHSCQSRLFIHSLVTCNFSWFLIDSMLTNRTQRRRKRECKSQICTQTICVDLNLLWSIWQSSSYLDKYPPSHLVEAVALSGVREDAEWSAFCHDLQHSQEENTCTNVLEEIKNRTSTYLTEPCMNLTKTQGRNGWIGDMVSWQVTLTRICVIPKLIWFFLCGTVNLRPINPGWDLIHLFTRTLLKAKIQFFSQLVVTLDSKTGISFQKARQKRVWWQEILKGFSLQFFSF